MMREAKYAKSSISRMLSVIREVYGALVRDEIVENNPAREVKQPKLSATPKTPYLDDEEKVEKLLNAPGETWPARRDLLCVRLLFGLGWRRREVARLLLSDFGDDYETVTGVFKGNKTVTVGVPAWLIECVAEWVDTQKTPPTALLPGTEGSKCAMSERSVYDAVVRVALRADIGPLSPHALRRTNITLGGARGVSLKERQLAVGHSSQATTERYDRARDASKNAPGQVFADLIKRK
jgi:integrase/recombinase XerC